LRAVAARARSSPLALTTRAQAPRARPRRPRKFPDCIAARFEEIVDTP
jgi:hypothetical protein